MYICLLPIFTFFIFCFPQRGKLIIGREISLHAQILKNNSGKTFLYIPLDRLNWEDQKKKKKQNNREIWNVWLHI